MIRGVQREGREGNYEAVRLGTDRGPILCRYYAAPAARGAAVYVGGVGGGWDTPARGLYPRLAEGLLAEGISSLRLRFQVPTDLEGSRLDVLAVLQFLVGEGLGAAGVVGHSFGGAVVIQAAAAWLAARTAVALAPQSYGADPAADLGPRCSLLLVHGTRDTILPHRRSEQVYRWARQPKRLLLLEGAGHGLDEAAEQVYQAVRGWLVRELAGRGGQEL
jgi:dienelactone hydrolase